MTDAQPVPTDPQALAEAVTAAMWSRATASTSRPAS